jgi:hypothetical protein
MENFSTLTASVSGGNVFLSWTLAGDAALATSVALQKSEYGLNNWATVQTVTPATLTVTRTPDPGQWAYRLAVTITRGGIDALGTTIYSNTVDVTVEAATGVISLSGSVTSPGNTGVAGPAGFSVINLSWVFDDADTDEGVLKYEVQRSVDGGTTYRHAANTPELSWREELATGTGTVKYRVVASLPNIGTGNQLNTPVLTTSNVVTLTV